MPRLLTATWSAACPPRAHQVAVVHTRLSNYDYHGLAALYEHRKQLHTLYETLRSRGISPQRGCSTTPGRTSAVS